MQPHCPPKTTCKNRRHMNARYEEGTRTEKSKLPHSKPKAACTNKKHFWPLEWLKKLAAKKARSQQLAKEAEFVQFSEAHRNKRSGNFKTKSSHQLRLKKLSELKNCNVSTENKLLNEDCFATCMIKILLVVSKEKTTTVSLKTLN